MVKEYKYELERGSKKFPCPQCGKKTFVRYVNLEEGGYLDDGFGRCDREQKCGYFRRPEKSISDVPFRGVHVPPRKNYIYLTREDVQGHFSDGKWKLNNLVQFFQRVLSDVQVTTLAKDYCISSIERWNDLATIFWNIDENGRVCSGKVMLYRKDTGKRIKKPFAHINSIHKIKQKEGIIGDYDIKPCLFGTHLLKTYTEKGTIAVCESEKTACAMSAIFPKYLWMATGGLSNIKDSSFRAIKNKSIVLYPDLGVYDSWKERAALLSKMGYKIVVSDILETNCPEGVEGSDILDYFMNKSTTGNVAKKIKTKPQKAELRTKNRKGNQEDIIDLSEVGPPSHFQVDLTNEVSKLKKFFLNSTFLSEAIDLSPGVRVLDAPLMIKTHFDIVEARPYNKSSLPYLDRLNQLKYKIQEQN